jgi:hypothetical protein
MNSRKSLGKAGVLGGLVNRSGGNVEVFDDHWAGMLVLSLIKDRSNQITYHSGVSNRDTCENDQMLCPASPSARLEYLVGL